ncbi:MAG: B12-binding domain-containing radical SAM protein [Hyphomicrobiales bacterium]|nr:B12-binding domain-containing radical SAM protein [Hyphomicrobiales bacterium]MBV8825971.1 B12-binding domain-containing radical SAM protein [Hyphomicrobiales bacterium]MBV9428542.1 B12-binding domain-containing radical SAM protein [Bradyrhizobiaceae bacterium]
MPAEGQAPGTRIALVGPREEAFLDNVDLEHRETMLRSYEEICGDVVAFGSDYTISREFLGIGYLAAVLRREGHLVRVIGANNSGLADDVVLTELLTFGPRVVGISVLYDLQLASAIILSKRLKAALPGVVIVFGGPLASAISELLLSTFPFIDCVIEGEGESALARLVEAVEVGTELGEVPALVHRGVNGIVRNPRAEPLDLDSLPHPSRDVIEAIRARRLPVPSAYLTTSRGCKAFCTFCTVPNIVRGMKTGVYRMRDPVDVVSEMESLVRDLGVTRFYMADDNFLGYGEDSNRRMLGLADEILRRRLRINFHAECRVDSLVPDTLVRLRAAGFDQILFGLESGSRRTLKRWAKGQTVEQNEAAISLARSLGLDMMPSIILLDWESDLAEVEETIAFIERNQLYRSGQPLWLVNKLKVHCGTAASRRYDNVHGKPVLPAISDDVSIRSWCAKATYQGIPIENAHVAAFWGALNGAANRWSVLLDEIVPRFLKAARQAARGADKVEQIELVRRIAMFRRSIGPWLVELMRLLIAEAMERERRCAPAGDWRDFAESFVAERERQFFAGGLAESLREHGRRRWFGAPAIGSGASAQALIGQTP